ncbi:MAG TPA: TfoX/Sxy family protein [Candidatus Limnocylindrales bacterium]|nr:TfoX/Sxy family protein [Candidatus Limnocylindrales bacterium]
MPSFEKSPPALIEHFATALARHAAPDITQKKMFGYPCAWIAGNMATGLFASEWWVRVSEPDREALLALPGAHPFQVMPGRDMGRYVVLPSDVVANEARLDDWLARALAFTRSLPPKS